MRPLYAVTPVKNTVLPWDKKILIKELGWIQTNENRCGGYYLEEPFYTSDTLIKSNSIQISSNQLMYAQHGTSVGEGEVTITRAGQQVIASKAYLYRDPQTGKLNAVELFDNVTLREPNSLVVAKYGKFNFTTKAQTLHQILYRTTIYNDLKKKPAPPAPAQLQQAQKVYQLSAWGQATSFNQDQPKIYEFEQASYSTCPPTDVAWKVAASHIELNKTTGRGTAQNAYLTVRGIPVFYTPYLSFPIDSRRKTGFLWPTIGRDTESGPILGTPFYWNMAPNYDMTITPTYLTKRNFMLADLFRYLTPTTKGEINIEVLPHDKFFTEFQNKMENQFGTSTDPVKQSELRILQNASAFRKALYWENTTRFNDHWSSEVDLNYVSDDYYLKNIDKNFNQVTQNQLLQVGEIDYKGQNWNFITRIQNYQTLHPVDEPVIFRNQYARLPQFVLAGNYTDNPGGFEYFIQNEATHFDIRKNPGEDLILPIGNRFYSQPGISRPFNTPYFSITPRLQFSMTDYALGNVDHQYPSSPRRFLPIFDINNALYFDRDIQLFGDAFRQTLEPRIYYTYIPYRNQNNLPIFDTTVNTLTYDQIFMYNRFSGLDRINDANQLAMGLTTRFINQQTGTEKIKAAIGQILYFQRRRVTLCSSLTNPSTCPPESHDFPSSGANERSLSPLTGSLSYAVSAYWSLTANSIWNPQIHKLDNQSLNLHFQPVGTQKIINIGYNFVRDGDRLQGEEPGSSASNLSSTDVSFSWPFLRDWTAVGRWTQNWNHGHFQNLLYGLQYDSCCWAIRFVTGRTFIGLSPTTNTFQYNTQFYLQFALKGLGTVPAYGGDPTQLLNTNISGIQNNFGRDF